MAIYNRFSLQERVCLNANTNAPCTVQNAHQQLLMTELHWVMREPLWGGVEAAGRTQPALAAQSPIALTTPPSPLRPQGMVSPHMSVPPRPAVSNGLSWHAPRAARPAACCWRSASLLPWERLWRRLRGSAAGTVGFAEAGGRRSHLVPNPGIKSVLVGIRCGLWYVL